MWKNSVTGTCTKYKLDSALLVFLLDQVLISIKTVLEFFIQYYLHLNNFCMYQKLRKKFTFRANWRQTKEPQIRLETKQFQHIWIYPLTVICLLMVRIFKGLLQLLCLAPQSEALQNLSGTGPLMLAAVLCYHLLLDVFELLIGEVLHKHRLKHLQTTSSVYKRFQTVQITELWTNAFKISFH